jgi:hypothetical protein
MTIHARWTLARVMVRVAMFRSTATTMMLALLTAAQLGNAHMRPSTATTVTRARWTAALRRLVVPTLRSKGVLAPTTGEQAARRRPGTTGVVLTQALVAPPVRVVRPRPAGPMGVVATHREQAARRKTAPAVEPLTRAAAPAGRVEREEVRLEGRAGAPVPVRVAVLLATVEWVARIPRMGAPAAVAWWMRPVARSARLERPRRHRSARTRAADAAAG